MSLFIQQASSLAHRLDMLAPARFAVRRRELRHFSTIKQLASTGLVGGRGLDAYEGSMRANHSESLCFGSAGILTEGHVPDQRGPREASLPATGAEVLRTGTCNGPSAAFNPIGLRFVEDTNSLEGVGVVGLGLMGHGIVQVTAMASNPSYDVVAVEANAAAIDAGRDRIGNSLSKMLARRVKTGALSAADAEEEKAQISSRITYATTKDAFAECDLVIEAITENPTIKLPLYEDLARITRPDCILASNTSSLSIQEMAEAAGRPSHVIGLHFFNPVQMMKLVEVVRTDATDSSVFESCKAWVQSIGKHPASCRDTPGFIVNRLLIPSLAQAMLMLDRGHGAVDDIDKSMELGAGHPMGPLTLADYVGLDTCLSILEGWVQKYPHESSFVVPLCLKEKVAAGKLGRKSGEGFYEWSGDKRTNVAT